MKRAEGGAVNVPLTKINATGRGLPVHYISLWRPLLLPGESRQASEVLTS